MAYFLANSSFWLFSFGLWAAFLGKSTFTRTRFFAAKSKNCEPSKTSLSILMHQGHQSEPVKSSRIYLCSCAACLDAAAKSVCQVSSVARKDVEAEISSTRAMAGDGDRQRFDG